MKHPLVKLADCCEIVSGATPRTDDPAYWGGDICWVTPKDLTDMEGRVLMDSPEKITTAGFASCSTQMLPIGTILLSSRAPIGHVAIAGRELCTNQGFKSLVPSARVNSAYLYHCIKHFVPRLAALGNGATFKEVSKKVVEEFTIPLPTSSVDQSAIAAKLDLAHDIVRRQKLLSAASDSYLRSAFISLFGDPVVNSKELDEVDVSEIATVTTGNTPSRQVSDYFGDYIEWIKSDNLNTPHHHLTQATEGLSQAGLRVGRSVPAGSTLITCIAGSPSCIGNAALADREVAFNQQINALTPKQGIEPEYLYAATLYSKARIQAASTNGMKGMVSKGNLERVRFILPSHREREKFVQIFRCSVSLSGKLERAAVEASALYGSLAQRAFEYLDCEVSSGH